MSEAKKNVVMSNGDTDNGIQCDISDYITAFHKFHLSVATGIREKADNASYGDYRLITSLEELAQAVQYDHVAAKLRDNYRDTKHFICADCIVMDCDNSHTDDPAGWLTPEKLFERLPGLKGYVVYSRNHMKDKIDYNADGTIKSIQTARPHFHLFSPSSQIITSADAVRAIKERLLEVVPEFDAGAKDAVRFFIGVEHPEVMANPYTATLCVDEWLNNGADMFTASTDSEASTGNSEGTGNSTKSSDCNEKGTHTHADGEQIPQGQRHTYLLNVAVQALKANDKHHARRIFDTACLRCTPQLPKKESEQIWQWALNLHEEINKASKRKPTISQPIIQQALADLGIEVKFDVITKKLLISDLPSDSPYTLKGYAYLAGFAKQQATRDLLPAFLYSYLRDRGYRVNTDFIASALSNIAMTQKYNPVLDMFLNTEPDRQDRIFKLCDILGFRDNSTYCGIFVKWLHQAVSLALNDEGTIAPAFVLVLQGPQGIGKTSFFKRLAVNPDWFLEGALLNMRDKDTQIRADEHWIAELGELDATLKREESSLKGYLTSARSDYRKPYARENSKIERRTCFCATVNPEQFLKDDTGSRRFVVIHCDHIDKDFIFNTMTPEWCAQLWRQVYERYYLINGATGFYLDDEEQRYSEAQNKRYRKPLDGEIELLDGLDWSELKASWTYKTATRIKDMLDLRLPSRQISKALQVLCMRHGAGEPKYDTHRKTTLYFTPGKRNVVDMEIRQQMGDSLD